MSVQNDIRGISVVLGLPIDLLYMLCTFLTSSETCVLRRVCRSFSDTVFPATVRIVLSEEKYLDFVDSVHRVYQSQSKIVRSLSLVRIESESVRRTFGALVVRFPLLDRLCLSNLELDELCFLAISSLLQLIWLEISYCRHLSESCFAYICELPCLQHLNLALCSQLTDAVLQKIALLHGTLLTLNMTRCSLISDDVITFLCKLRHLQGLDLFGCVLITDKRYYSCIRFHIC